MTEMTSPQSASTLCSRRAFTLVELLVVIGIIAVLMSLLLPALSRARYAARLTQCASNMRQFTISIQSYSAENKGWFPSEDLPGTGRNLWDVSTDFYDVLNTSYGLPHEMFFCPLQPPELSVDFFNIFGYFDIIGYSLWIPRKNGGITVPPNPGDPGFSYIDTKVFAGPPRMGDPQVNVAPVLTDFVGTGAATATSDVSTDNTLGLNTWSQHQLRQQYVESSNEAYADGHVERVRGHDLHPAPRQLLELVVTAAKAMLLISTNCFLLVATSHFSAFC